MAKTIELMTHSIEREQDLDNVNPGELVKVNGFEEWDEIHLGWRVYEGLIDDKDSFLLQSPSTPNKILSIRSHRRYLQFGADLGDAISKVRVNHLYYNFVHHTPGSKNYDFVKNLLINANMWEEPK